jgi:hypothetical protein
MWIPTQDEAVEMYAAFWRHVTEAQQLGWLVRLQKTFRPQEIQTVIRSGAMWQMLSSAALKWKTSRHCREDGLFFGRCLPL